MKLRMLTLAMAMLILSSLSFAQLTMVWEYSAVGEFGGGTEGWRPLTYCGDAATPEFPDSPVLMDGTKIRIYHSGMDGVPGGNFQPINPATDLWLPLGENGGAGEVTVNEWEFNATDPTFNRPLGSFISPLVQFVGATPNGESGQAWFVYLQIGCYDDQGNWTCMYYSQRFNVAGSYLGANIACPNGGFFFEACWTRVNCCEPPSQCEGTATPFEITSGPAGSHGLTPDPDQPQNNCVYLCPGADLEVVVGPTWSDETPDLYVDPGCDLPCDDPTCTPAVFSFNPVGVWVPITPDDIVGYWHYVIQVEFEGCACIRLEDIFPAEMGSVDIAARDNAVSLSWNTLSESGLDYFVIARDGVERARINANNAPSGATYTYSDEARNGVTYEYTLSVVDVSGGVRALATQSVTPSVNAVGTITEYALHQNFPNPFNPTTNIIFDVVNENHVDLTVYNAMGQVVATLVNGTYGNGRHSVEFSSENLTSGLYFYTVKVGNEFTATKKMLLVK